MACVTLLADDSGRAQASSLWLSPLPHLWCPGLIPRSRRTQQQWTGPVQERPPLASENLPAPTGKQGQSPGPLRSQRETLCPDFSDLARMAGHLEERSGPSPPAAPSSLDQPRGLLSEDELLAQQLLRGQVPRSSRASALMLSVLGASPLLTGTARILGPLGTVLC